MARNKKSIQAEEDWLKNFTLQQIADKYRVKLETVKDWHARYKWAQKRKEMSRRQSESQFDKILKESQQHARKSLRQGRILAGVLDVAIRNLAKRAKGQEVEDLPKCLPQDLAECCTLLRKLSGLHRDVIPDFNDQIGSMIVQELQERNEADDGTQNDQPS